MSKESIRMHIRSLQGDIARWRGSIASLRARKRDTVARYSANIRAASSASMKASLRGQKATATSYIDSQIRAEQGRIATAQNQIASLRVRLKTER